MDAKSISGLIKDCKTTFGTTNFYHILEIPINKRKNLTDRDLTLAYHELSKKFHPDKNGEISKFQTLAKVYAAISDPNIFKLYLAIREQEEDVDLGKMSIPQNEETLKEKLNNLQNEYSELVKKFTMKCKKNEDLEKTVFQLMKEKGAFKNQNNNLKKYTDSLRNLKKTVFDLMKEKNALKKQNDELEADYECLQIEYEEFYYIEYENTNSLEEKNLNLEILKNAFVEKNNYLLKENYCLRKGLENCISQLTKEKKVLQNQNDGRLRSNSLFLPEFERSLFDKNNLNKELKKMKEDMSALQKEISEMKKKGLTSRFAKFCSISRKKL